VIGRVAGLVVGRVAGFVAGRTAGRAAGHAAERAAERAAEHVAEHVGGFVNELAGLVAGIVTEAALTRWIAGMGRIEHQIEYRFVERVLEGKIVPQTLGMRFEVDSLYSLVEIVDLQASRGM
jgi:hypothetical protein